MAEKVCSDGGWAQSTSSEICLDEPPLSPVLGGEGVPTKHQEQSFFPSGDHLGNEQMLLGEGLALKGQTLTFLSSKKPNRLSYNMSRLDFILFPQALVKYAHTLSDLSLGISHPSQDPFQSFREGRAVP